MRVAIPTAVRSVGNPEVICILGEPRRVSYPQEELIRRMWTLSAQVDGTAQESPRGVLRLSGSASGGVGIADYILTDPSLVGRTVRLTFDVVGGTAYCKVGTTLNGGELYPSASQVAGNGKVVTFVPTSATTYIRLLRNGSTTPVTIKNISARTVAWVAPGATDALFGAGSAPNFDPGPKPFPVLTYDRHHVDGLDLQDQTAPITPNVGAWPGGMLLRTTEGKTGIPPGQTGEGSGSYIRISRGHVDALGVWEHAAYLLAGEYPLESGAAVTNCYVKCLADGRALFVMTHGASGYRVTARVLTNPRAPVADWVWGPWCRLGWGFPSHPVYADNGELIGTLAGYNQGLSAPYGEQNKSLFGFYRVDANTHTVVFNAISEFPMVEPGVDHNSYAEASVIQTASRTFTILYRTKTTYYYTTSTDAGATWSAPQQFTALSTVRSKMWMDRLPDGRLLCLHNELYNNDTERRSDMIASVSKVGAGPVDAGAWVSSFKLQTKSWLSYPDAAIIPDVAGVWRGDVAYVYDHGRNSIPSYGETPSGYFANIITGRLSTPSILRADPTPFVAVEQTG
jgi:hypothetical protein